MTDKLAGRASSPYRPPVPPLNVLATLVEDPRPQFTEVRRSTPGSAVRGQDFRYTAASHWSLSDFGLLGAPELMDRRASHAGTRRPVPHNELVFQFRESSLPDLAAPKAHTRKEWLVDALSELEEIDQQAAEDELPPRSDLSKQNARRIIEELAKGPYPAPAVYPTEDGEIAILFQRRAARASVLILCDGDGAIAYFSTIAGRKQRSRYDDASGLPDALIKGELLKLRVA